jgi:hypothetical protein
MTWPCAGWQPSPAVRVTIASSSCRDPADDPTTDLPEVDQHPIEVHIALHGVEHAADPALAVIAPRPGPTSVRRSTPAVGTNKRVAPATLCDSVR